MRDLQEFFDIELATANSSIPEIGRNRMNLLLDRIDTAIGNLPDFDLLLELDYTCDFKSLYEVVVCNLKFSLVDLQNREKKLGAIERDKMVWKVRRMESNFGIGSEQFFDAVTVLNRFDDRILKEKANKYREFVLKNNERPTSAFCLLGKENNLMDDLGQIKDANGVNFPDEVSRKNFIKNFYGELYKKKWTI